MYRLIILKDSTIYTNITPSIYLTTEIANRLPHLLSGDRKNKATQDSLTSDLRDLYQYLLADVEEHLPDTLHIVANGWLSSVPFAALRTDTSGNVPAYFGMDHTLSRQFGIKVFELLSERPTKAKYTQPLALSPDFGNDYAVAMAFREVDVELSPLTFNQQEVANLQALGDGEYLYGDAATDEAFLENAPDYSIIHLATHGAANLSNGMDSRIFLLNEDDEPVAINAEEISRQRINADLVTLSACETGSGGRHLLEGTVGLTKSFLMAGSRSVVSSLWAVDDKITSDIMSGFYAELRSGQPIHAALQTAQREHLERYEGTELAHPAYWAAFVPYGSMETPAWTDDGFPWLWLGVAFVVAVFAFLGYRKFA